MANVRKNIIIAQDLWDKVAALAADQKASISELISKALKKEYDTDEAIYAKRKKAFQEIMQIREGTRGKVTTQEILEWRHEDHKY